ncbi:unnamed protein product [Lactuca saligna]|uniref:Sulfotransferase n=1 Tax=Lactuca saligna TaxID=75948 RepID=A0AA36EHT0_LACSI|nr:unnamed protein product [Lactuca saligna]
MSTCTCSKINHHPTIVNCSGHCPDRSSASTSSSRPTTVDSSPTHQFHLPQHSANNLVSRLLQHRCREMKNTSLPKLRVLFLTNEKLETETSFNVRRLAQFLGRPFSLDEEMRGVVRKISMKKTKEIQRNKDVEDQMDYLSQEMKDHIDQITKNRFKGSGLIIG